MTEEKEKKEKSNEVKDYKLVEVPTQHTIAIQTPEGNLMSTEAAMVMILNKLDEIKKVIG